MIFHLLETAEDTKHEEQKRGITKNEGEKWPDTVKTTSFLVQWIKIKNHVLINFISYSNFVLPFSENTMKVNIVTFNVSWNSRSKNRFHRELDVKY
jgi:hypothetical protein